MGAWPLPTGDSLVVPSRAQVYLIGPCDRSFQTTPLRLTMSSGREAHRRRDTEAGGCASPWHGSLQPPEGPPELQIRLPDVELKSTGGVPVKDFTRLPDHRWSRLRTERLAAAGGLRPRFPVASSKAGCDKRVPKRPRPGNFRPSAVRPSAIRPSAVRPSAVRPNFKQNLRPW